MQWKLCDRQNGHLNLVVKHDILLNTSFANNIQVPHEGVVKHKLLMLSSINEVYPGGN